MATSPWNSIRNYISDWGVGKVLDHSGVEVIVPLGSLIRTGTAPDPVLTRVSANLVTLVSTGDGTEVTYLNYNVPMNNFVVTSRGWKVNSVTIDYTVGVTAVTDIQVALASLATAAAGGTAAALTGTYDAAHDTTAERKATGNHRLVYTITTPTTFSTAKTSLALEIQLDTLNTAVTTIRGITLNLTLLTP